MSHAIRIHRTGGPDVLKWEEVDVGEPGPGQVKLRHEAIGLNFIDVYHRTGLYPVLTAARTRLSIRNRISSRR
jgi:NADPH2:quinone reductase